MATLVLSAAGAALGGSIGGTVAGLSMAAIGRAAGAVIGRSIDNKLLGQGAEPVETGRVDQLRLSGASEGAAVGQVYGRMRVGGQMIWATKFQEHVSTSGGSGGGKGTPKPAQPETHTYSYSISVAIAVCEGEITSIGRIWANGEEIATADLNMRVYKGTQTQTADPKIAAVEGAENTPAYRGIAYVVFEDLDLTPFGNRVPQFNFEVMRPSKNEGNPIAQDLSHVVTSVAIMPGSGEYALATTPVYFDKGHGVVSPANLNTASGQSDIETSLDALVEELPKCESTSLIVSWFGDDLRCNHCTLRPKVEQNDAEGDKMPWRVSGLTRAQADQVTYLEDRPAYGGTPTDQSVVEAIQAIQAHDQAVMFYPFILMDQAAGNALPNPWGGDEQPHFPWRGRITLNLAPDQTGTPDKTAIADTQVAAFFGQAARDDFSWNGTTVVYSGPAEWSYRRFILHYAHLCAAAGGVDAFCIGSEMRGMTQIRGAGNVFVTVQKLIELAGDVRAILGADCKISYAADWSEYFGYQPQDGSHDRYFHLDPLWADANIDFVGIDNYMPLSDWRDGDDHADAAHGSIYNLDYLMGNVEGGEGYDWYYASDADRDAQIRTPITDQDEFEPWVWRYKDIKNWWKNPHYERVNGVRSLTPTSWVPEGKPIWFTEIGCGAVDKGTNQPNKFLDPKSAESSTPYYSDGRRDELIQMQYLRAIYSYWTMEGNNPTSREYDAPMLDMNRAHVWAWDARPFPAFPGLLDVWSDGENYTHGHWLSGRTAARPLDSVVREICARSGVSDINTDELYGYVRGFVVPDVGSARQALQPLMLAYGFDAVERDGVLVFKNRTARGPETVDHGELVIGPDTEQAIEHTRAPVAEIADRVRLRHVHADGSYETRVVEAIFPEDDTEVISETELALAFTVAEATQICERWLAESRLSRDTAQFALPPSKAHLGAGDVVAIAEPGGMATYRLDQVEIGAAQLVQAVRVEDDVYKPLDLAEEAITAVSITPAVPVFAQFMDLPLITGDETPHAPHLAISANPWPGVAAVYGSATDSDYILKDVVGVAATLGVTLSDMAWAKPAILDHGPALRVQLTQGSLSGLPHDSILAGGNLAAIGDGSVDNWELFQFESAELVGENTYDISTRLRGQLGSDALMPDAWPAGSTFVLLNGVPDQIALPSSARNVAQHYRIGPSNRGMDDPSYRHQTHAFAGNGLRPYAPVWVQVTDVDGDKAFTWTRRTRLNGDGWDLPEVPLSEANEQYHIRVLSGETLLRDAYITTPEWTYTAADMTADGANGPLRFEVAQVSDTYGAGLYRELVF